jgi:hypothetical protein
LFRDRDSFRLHRDFDPRSFLLPSQVCDTWIFGKNAIEKGDRIFFFQLLLVCENWEFEQSLCNRESLFDFLTFDIIVGGREPLQQIKSLDNPDMEFLSFEYELSNYRVNVASGEGMLRISLEFFDLDFLMLEVSSQFSLFCYIASASSFPLSTNSA